MTDTNLLRALVTIAFGAIAGGVTNAVAIWMLFHPYESRGIGRLRLQGAIPKNKPRLAKTIGRTVGERLLTSDDLTRQLSAPGLRDAFDAAIGGFVQTQLHTERGSLRDEMPEKLRTEIESAFEVLAPAIADRLIKFAETDAFRAAVAGLQARIHADVGDRPISDLLTDERRGALKRRVEEWVAEAVMSPDLEAAIGQWLDRQVTRFQEDDTPLLERLPASLVAAVEKEMAGYLPIALDRIGSALSDPNARRRIQTSLHKLFDGFVKNLLIHERIVARLVVTEKTIARLLDNVERDGVEQVARLLEEPEMRTQVARSVNDAVVKFLRQPLAEHLRALGPQRVEGIKATARRHIIAALQDTATRTFAIDKVDEVVREGAKGRTIADILRHIPADEAAEWAASAIASPRAREWIEEGCNAALTAMLDRPIGRPADLLPVGSVERVTAGLSPVVWDWLQEQIPKVVAKLDIQQMVEDKVLGFSLARIEEIVRRTTQRELDLIIKLGYVLGAFVGAIAYTVSVFLP